MPRFLFCLILGVWSFNLLAQSDSVRAEVKYGSKGWALSYGENYLMNLQWRVQFRLNFQSNEPDFFVPEEDNLHGSFNIQRARLKVGGHAFSPHLKYYLEYDFPSNNLLNWEFTLARFKQIQLRVGQWKVDYNTERVVSSGKQQFVDRSIANRFFTLDRQMGIGLQGTLFDKTPFCASYYAGIFNGNGRGAVNDDSSPMWLARYQWNLTGSAPNKSFSDLERSEKPQIFAAVSWTTNESAYTQFSSSGGGDLPGYTEGTINQYLLDQWGFEIFSKFKGWSLMGEYHRKMVDDQLLNHSSVITGGYVMTGYFPSEVISSFPRSLEVIFRYGQVAHRDLFNEDLQEYTFGLNWFFKDHLNKLTLDYSLLNNQDFEADSDDQRVRLQWDISF